MAMSLIRIPIALAALITALITGCGREAGDADPEAARPSPVAELPDEIDTRWRGVLPCVDCEGLEVDLQLRRDAGGPAQFILAERYLGGAAEGEFTTSGEWREVPCSLGRDAGTCIVLIEAGQQWFRHADGSLQAVTAEGEPVDGDGSRLRRR